VYREKKDELRKGIESFTKLPAAFDDNETFLFVVADGALTREGGVHKVARKYMKLLGATWAGVSDEQRCFWENDKSLLPTWFGSAKCGYVWSAQHRTPIPMVLLLKNTEQCIRQRKIWSHILSFLLLRRAGVLDAPSSLALMIDGDTSFGPDHVRR